MRRNVPVALLGLLATLVMAAAVFFPLAAMHEEHDESVHLPAAPGPVILSDQFPIDQNLMEEAIQDP